MAGGRGRGNRHRPYQYHGEMIDATLTRLETSDQGTFGRFVAGRLGLFSGELPDHDNASNVSRIPAGTYRCVFSHSPRFGRNLYLVDSVPARAGIRLHTANLMGDNPPYRRQLNGCIALGERLGWIEGQKALLLSAPAMRRAESYFSGRPFTLEIRE